MKIKIIFEDNHILIVEKPVNILSQKDDTNDDDMLTLLKDDLKVRHNKPGNVFLGLVHRLDRPVGGVMVFAKTSKAASRLSDSIRKREFEKTYLAVVNGRILNERDTLKHYLLKDKSKNIVRAVKENTPEAKDAVLDYELIEYSEDYSLVKVNLHTGRSHQIRVQFAAIKHPLFGDQKYGTHINTPGQQIALWSYEIGFLHPTKGEWIKFNSNPPPKEPWNLFREI